MHVPTLAVVPSPVQNLNWPLATAVRVAELAETPTLVSRKSWVRLPTEHACDGFIEGPQKAPSVQLEFSLRRARNS